MARRSRFHQPFTIYHVMLRGNAGQSIFFSDEDRCYMCLLLQEGIQRFNYLIHSFCFMDNHIHLAIQVNETSISRVMQNLAFRYTRYINKKLNRIGHLFQGRFKSVIVDDKMYLKELVRYIHLNPIRAGLVNSPEKYFWSSHRSYLMLNEYAWLTFDYVLKKFGVNRREALIDYENFVLKGIDKETTLDFKRGCSDGILGDEEFVEDFLGAVNKSQKREIQLPDLVEKICEKFEISIKALQNPGKQRIESHARGVLALFVKESDNLSIEELAKFLGREPSGLSKLCRRLEQKCFESAIFNSEIDVLRKSIYLSESQMSECQASPLF